MGEKIGFEPATTFLWAYLCGYAGAYGLLKGLEQVMSKEQALIAEGAVASLVAIVSGLEYLRTQWAGALGVFFGSPSPLIRELIEYALAR